MNVRGVLLRGGPGGELVARAKAALDAGLHGLVLEGPLYLRQWEALRDEVPRQAFLAIQLFLPYPGGLKEGQPSPLQLGSLHAEDRRDALRYGSETILLAAERDIPVVRVEPFPEGEARPAERSLLRRRRLDSLRLTLEKLLDLADRHHRTIALTTAVTPHDIPCLEEIMTLAAELAGAPLAAWVDTRLLAAELRSPRTGEPPPHPPYAAAILREAGEGEGAVPWDRLRPGLEPIPLWIADCDTPGRAFDLEGALRAIEALARVPEPPLRPGFYVG
jgi:hypothetical protein